MGRTGEHAVSEGSYHMLHEGGKETVRRGTHYKRGIWDKRKTKIPHFLSVQSLHLSNAGAHADRTRKQEVDYFRGWEEESHGEGNGR